MMADSLVMTRLAIGASALSLVLGCAPEKSPVAERPSSQETPAPGAGIDYTFESLDVSTLGAQSSDWCTLPELSPSAFVHIDKATFRDLLADYVLAWMTPLHDGIGTLDEQNLFDASFEMLWSTFNTDCDGNTDEDLTFSDDMLTDEETRADVREEVSKFIEGATEIASGEVLRLSIHDCEECDEPLGAKPFLVDVRLTNDGVLVIEVELTEGTGFTRSFFITPDAMAVQADAAQFARWMEGFSSDTRSGEITVPDATGEVTVVTRKSATGVSATLGISGGSFDSQPGDEDNVHIKMDTPCFGMHMGLDTATGAAQAATNIGDVSTTIPGHLHCDEDSCDAAELESDWVYQLGGLALSAEQPAGSATPHLVVGVNTDHASIARVGDNLFAEGGLGPRGEGGTLSASVENSKAGYLVTFHPALDFGGAMKISAFSEKLKLELPDWLADEIFDVTLGGDTRSSVFVPARAECAPWDSPDAVDPPEPARRELEIREGSLSAAGGSGVKEALAGQCVGKTLEPESSLLLVSDWVDVGFVCARK